MLGLARARRSVLYRFRIVLDMVMIAIERFFSVFRRAMVMILQNLDDPALADMAVAAFIHHTLQLSPQGLKLLQPQFHLFKM